MLKMVSLFSILAIIISCLGLFGMATYVIERKRNRYPARKRCKNFRNYMVIKPEFYSSYSDCFPDCLSAGLFCFKPMAGAICTPCKHRWGYFHFVCFYYGFKESFVLNMPFLSIQHKRKIPVKPKFYRDCQLFGLFCLGLWRRERIMNLNSIFRSNQTITSFKMSICNETVTTSCLFLTVADVKVSACFLKQI